MQPERPGFLKIFTPPYSNTLRGYLFVLPCLLLLILVLGFPMAAAVANSFTPIWSPEKTFSVTNYVNLIVDKLFWNALRVTGVFVSSTVVLHLLIGFAVALALNTAVRAKKIIGSWPFCPGRCPMSSQV